MEQAESYPVNEIGWPEKIFLVKKSKIVFSQLPMFFIGAYGEIYGALKKAGIEPVGMPLAFYYSTDEVKKETFVAAAVRISEDPGTPEGLEKIQLPPSRLITTTHYGPYESMPAAYACMEEYLETNRLKKGLIIEEYFSDPAKEKDPAKWKTKIYFMLE